MTSREIAAVWIVGIVMSGVVLLNIYYGLESYTYQDSLSKFSDIARNFSLIALGLIGLPLAIWRSFVAAQQSKTALRQAKHTEDQIRLARQGQLADRFQKATEMLGSKSQMTREAGVFALHQIAIEDPKTYLATAGSVLCTFAREQSSAIRNEEELPLLPSDFLAGQMGYQNWGNDLPQSTNDLQSAFAAISDLKRHEVEANRNAKFFRAELNHTYWAWSVMVAPRYDFLYTTFSYAYMNNSIIKNARFISSYITGGTLDFSKFENCDFNDCEINPVSAEGCRFTAGSLDNAILGDDWIVVPSEDEGWDTLVRKSEVPAT